MNQAALRRQRWSISDQSHFVTIVTRRYTPLFVEFDIARRVVDEMRRVDEGRVLVSLAWVLMPDHLHWLFVLRERAPLAFVMHDFKSRSAAAVNRATRHRASVWQSGYQYRAVQCDAELQSLGRYIVGNPVRARLVGRLGDYPHWDAIWV
jgi:REP element-mobilizing transposase RayT